MVKSDFLQFSVKDFILDESFQFWVAHSHRVPDKEWEAWLEHNPERNSVVDEARSFISDVRDALDEVVTLDEAEEGWLSIESRLALH